MDKPHHPIVIQPWKIRQTQRTERNVQVKMGKGVGGSFRRRQRSLLRRKPASRVPRRSLRLDCSPTSKKRVESNHGFVLFGRGSPGSGGFAEITIGDCVATDVYEIKSCSPSRLSLRDLGRCIRIVSAGDAVDPDSAALEIPRAQVLAVASAGNLIVGVGAVKHRRPEYASHIAARSGVSFDPTASELGYVAIETPGAVPVGAHRTRTVGQASRHAVCYYIIRTHEEDPGADWVRAERALLGRPKRSAAFTLDQGKVDLLSPPFTRQVPTPGVHLQ